MKTSEDSKIVQSYNHVTIADLLIAFGGMFRSLYFIGLIMAHSVAKMMY